MRISISIIVVIVFLVACHEGPEDRKTYEKIDFTTDPHISVCYQIQTGDKLLGYADKHEWQNAGGTSRHYYYIYDPKRLLIGQILWDGNTRKYRGDGKTEVIGNFDLSVGLQRIYNVNELSFFPAGQTPPEPSIEEQAEEQALAQESQAQEDVIAEPVDVSGEEEFFESDVDDIFAEDDSFDF